MKLRTLIERAAERYGCSVEEFLEHDAKFIAECLQEEASFAGVFLFSKVDHDDLLMEMRETA